MYRLSTDHVIAARGRGRPKRLSGNAGRDALIAAAQTILRSKPAVVLSKKALALEAGVAPALIYYHFADEISLIDAAARPIVETYKQQIQNIIRHDSSTRERLRRLIALLLRMELNDGRLLDAYIGCRRMQRDDIRETVLDVARGDLEWFFDECAKSGYLRPLDARLMATVLWGTCKTMAQAYALAAVVRRSTGDTAQLESQKADVIMDLLVTGFGRPDDP